MVRRLVVFTFVAAFAVFCVVQDRVTAAGAHLYAEQARLAIGRHELVTPVDSVMRPAIHRSVQLGLASAGVVLASGLSAAFIIARTRRG